MSDTKKSEGDKAEVHVGMKDYVFEPSPKEQETIRILRELGIDTEEVDDEGRKKYGILSYDEQLYYDYRLKSVQDRDFKRISRNAKKRYGYRVKPFVDLMRDKGVSPYHFGKFFREPQLFIQAYNAVQDAGLITSYEQDNGMGQTRLALKDGKVIEVPQSTKAIKGPEHPADIEEIETKTEQLSLESKSDAADDSVLSTVLRMSASKK